MNRKFKALMFLLSIVMMGMTQGGGGGGGDGGGGSYDSGGGSYDYGSGGDSSSSVSCTDQCQSDELTTDQFDACFANCQQKRKKGTQNFLAIFLPLIIGVPLIIISSCCIFFRFCKSKQKNDIKNQMNIVNNFTITPQNFQYLKKIIVQLFVECGKGISQFSFTQRNQKHKLTNIKVQVISQKPYLTEVLIKGDDTFGQWTSEAFILNRNSGLFFWMLKEYNDKEKAGQTGVWEHLIYESTDLTQEIGIKGKWYYKGFQNDDSYSGIWQIIREKSLQYSENLKQASYETAQIKYQ